MPSFFSAAFPLIEKAHGLPVGVIDAVIEQESSGDPQACRYEPAYFERYIRGVAPSSLRGFWPLRASEDTERIGRATSWGLMQIMGQTARELGYELSFFTGLCVPTIGVEFGARCLGEKLRLYGNIADALSAYNAGSPRQSNRVTYVDPILRRMQEAATV